MPHFIQNDRYLKLQDDLREAALTTDWRSAIAWVLACADVLPEGCRADFVQEGEVLRAA